MIVCSCHGTSDHEFRKAVRAAAQGRPNNCRAGTCCGCCMETLLRLAQDEQTRASTESESGEEPLRVLQDR